MRAVADKIKVPTALWEGLKRVGIARGHVVRRAQIPISVLRDGAPVTTMQFFAIWRALAELSTDPVVGIRIAVSLDGAAMPPSFLAAYYARDLRDALQRVVRFKRLCAPEDVLIEERDQALEQRAGHAAEEVEPLALERREKFLRAGGIV